MVVGLPLHKYCAESRLRGTGGLQVATRGAIAFILAFTIMSSTVVMFTNTALLATTGNTIDTSNDHATLSSSPTTTFIKEISPYTIVGTPTVQAPLQIARTLQSNDLVNSLAFYEVTFITSTTGAIDKIRMDFPTGTNIAAAGVIERVGIGGGTLLKSGSSVTYDVTTPVSIPAGTFIRLEVFGIKNPIIPTTFTATITTGDSDGNLIDGPSQTNVYTVRQVDTNDIADGAITGNKIAGTNKLIFGTCTGSLPSLDPGDQLAVTCPDSNAENDDEIVGFWSNSRFLPAPVLINGITLSDSVSFGFENAHSVDSAAQPSVEVSYLIF